MNAFILLALALALAGGSSIYLASPHQRWRAASWPSRPARWLGVALLLASLFAFGHVMQASAAAFSFVTTVMLIFVLLPYGGALLSVGRER